MRLRTSLAILLATLISLPAAAQTAGRLGGRQALTGLSAQRGGDGGELFSGVLLGANAVPASASEARGYAFGLFDPGTNTLDAGAIVDGLEGGFVSAEIRSGAAGTSGTLIAQADFVEDNGPSVRAEFVLTLTDPQVVLLQAGSLYVAVQTSAFPGGEVRAQIVATDYLNEVRAQPVGSAVSAFGYVVRAKGAFTYLNDGTGGIAIRQTAGPLFDAVQNGSVRPGTVLRVAGTTSDFRGLLQIDGADIASVEIANDLDENVNGFAELVTLEELADGPELYESVLVFIGATIADGAGGTFAAATTYSLTDTTNPVQPVALRIPDVADTEIEGQPIPTGPVVVVGVVSQLESAVAADDGYQILAIEDYDVDPRGLVQIVHNSADPALASVFVNVNGNGPEAPLAFRSSTGLLEVPALAFLVVEASKADAFAVVLPEDTPRVFVLQGVADLNAFAPNPDGIDTSLHLADVTPSLTFAGDIVALLTANSVTDAPAISLRSGPSVYATDVLYSGFPFEVGLLPQALSLTVYNGATTFGTFETTFIGLGGQSVALMTSGFLAPEDNQNGAAFSLLVVTEDGTVTVLPNLSVSAEDAPGASALRVAAVANPVRSRTAVRYTLGAAGPARVSLVDVLGREVAVLADGDASVGTHEATLSAAALAPGVYTLRLVAGGHTATSRVTVVR